MYNSIKGMNQGEIERYLGKLGIDYWFPKKINYPDNYFKRSYKDLQSTAVEINAQY